ncbi:hypothetical protein GOODEAATRI_010003 [Goodea atripinnis]|uniref:Ig-like domain-containing protein n=1 Tax=Goodea atripinnis TaxID=208336 RepID=A0ABV0MQV3_9TELE
MLRIQGTEANLTSRWQRFLDLSTWSALQIENSEELDQGKYECVASNVEGVRYSSPANLYVRGREQPDCRARQ